MVAAGTKVWELLLPAKGEDGIALSAYCLEGEEERILEEAMPTMGGGELLTEDKGEVRPEVNGDPSERGSATGDGDPPVTEERFGMASMF